MLIQRDRRIFRKKPYFLYASFFTQSIKTAIRVTGGTVRPTASVRPLIHRKYPAEICAIANKTVVFVKYVCYNHSDVFFAFKIPGSAVFTYR